MSTILSSKPQTKMSVSELKSIADALTHYGYKLIVSTDMQQASIIDKLTGKQVVTCSQINKNRLYIFVKLLKLQQKVASYTTNEFKLIISEDGNSAVLFNGKDCLKVSGLFDGNIDKYNLFRQNVRNNCINWKNENVSEPDELNFDNRTPEIQFFN
jgi:hypothetical protein